MSKINKEITDTVPQKESDAVPEPKAEETVVKAATFSADERNPCDWELFKEEEGVTATHRITRKEFKGELTEFNLALKA